MQNVPVYLASPYSHPDPRERERRFNAACRATAELMRSGKSVFSPIVAGHPLCRYGLPGDWQFWQQHDLAFLAICDEVIVLKLEGWQQSVGVQAEIAAAKVLGKYVRNADGVYVERVYYPANYGVLGIGN